MLLRRLDFCGVPDLRYCGKFRKNINAKSFLHRIDLGRNCGPIEACMRLGSAIALYC
jgi:hypothetical protein